MSAERKKTATERENAAGPNRRQFLKSAAAAAVATGPWIIPASARGADGFVAPSNRIALGCVGAGGRGTGDMEGLMGFPEVQVVAICDVDAKNRENARKMAEAKYADRKASGEYKGCDAVNDFREVVDRADIDAILMATPDHWHALVVTAAARAGKDIYGEKPLALTIEQGRIMSDAVKRHGVIFQTGSQQRSDDKFRHACELVRNGRIGKLVRVVVGLPAGSAIDPLPPVPVPEGFDYDMWLGPAPFHPYTEKRTHWDFRWHLDYSGGQITDWGAHHCDIAQWGMGTESTGPVEIAGEGEFPKNGPWNAATQYAFDCLYANGVVMSVSTKHKGGVKFEGDTGWVWVNRGEIEASEPWLLTETFSPGEVHLYKSDDHYRNFLDCVRSRREPIAPIETAHRSISIAHLGNIAMQLGRKLRWDPKAERFVGDPEADRKLSRAMRGPWRL